MGWQLFPTGIGWRAFSKTLEEGRYECPNMRCKGRSDQVQAYRLRQERNWFTVLFIPLIPLNVRGVYVECRSCKTVSPASVLASPKSDRSPDSAPRSRTPTASDGANPSARDLSGTAQPESGLSAAPETGVPSAAQLEPIAASSSEQIDLDATTSKTHGQIARSIRGHLVIEGVGSFPVRSTIVLGRDPTPPLGYEQSETYSVEDASRTVSKTHAVVGFDEVGPWIADLGSANGVVVTNPDSAEEVLRSSSTRLSPGDSFRLGAVTMQVDVAT